MDKVIRHITPLLVLLLISISSFSQIYNTQIEAKINLEANAEFLEITGSAYNKTEVNQSLRFMLRVIRNELKNTNASKNDQSGRIVLNPGEKKNLSKTVINANDTDRIIVLLLIYDQDSSLLGKDRLVINGTEEDKKLAAKMNESVYVSADASHKTDDVVLLRGIVVEDTKTKPGRDFYNLFYTEYRNQNINGEKIITIKETLSLANNTKIEVLVEGVKILEFFVRPQPDYLKAYSNEAIRRANIYFNNFREGKYIVKHY